MPGDSQQLYDEIYCARGEMENRINPAQLEQEISRFIAFYNGCSAPGSPDTRLLFTRPVVKGPRTRLSEPAED